MYVAELSPEQFAARFSGSGAAYAAARNEERIIRRAEVAAWKSSKAPARIPAGRTSDRPPSKRMQRINSAIAANHTAEAAEQAEVRVPTVSAVQPEPVDRAAALDAEITRLKATITAAQQHLAEVETERRSLKLAAVAARLNREFAEFNAEFGEDDTEPLISDDLVRDVLARAEKKAQGRVIETETEAAAEVAAEPMTAAPATVEVSIPTDAVETKTKKTVRMTADNPFLAALQDDEDYIVEVVDTDTAAETGAVKAEVEVKTIPFVTDHGVTYIPTPEPSFAEVFATFEPDHVAAVAQGAAARFVAAPGRRWLIAARADQIDNGTGEVVVRRADGTHTVPILGDVIARCGSVAVYAVAVSGNRAVA